MKSYKLDEADLLVVIKIADLNLTKERVLLFNETYSHWIEAANELNRKMSQEEYRTLTPITVFKHDEKVYE
ncbi:MAG: hypothetical protein Q4G44_10385 [Alcaligenaceae bacterium]|nr:hypothetical protein [Alcaligenaceae bacterium]